MIAVFAGGWKCVCAAITIYVHVCGQMCYKKRTFYDLFGTIFFTWKRTHIQPLGHT